MMKPSRSRNPIIRGFEVGATVLLMVLTVGAFPAIAQTVELHVDITGTGFGQVEISPQPSGTGKFVCDNNTPDCTIEYDLAEPLQVTLTAIPSNLTLFSFFDGWTGCPSPSGNQCTVVMDTAQTVGVALNLVLVPDVVGQSQSAAQTTLTNAGFTVGTVTTANSNSVPAGNVISQNPTAGQNVAPGTAVDLVVSDGPAPVSVPNVVGLAQGAAQTAITNAGLTVGTVTTA
ncbi:MAG: PASTA domain-containing protein, partial [Nitrospirales bacterium]